MTHWWVNHNQTWEHETGRGFMWSPKQQRNGARSEYYDNMRRLIPGDRVFSFYASRLQQIGVIQDVAITANRPREFGAAGNAWANIGWRVPVYWSELPRRLHPAEHIVMLRQYLPDHHSPISPDTGHGNQCYLTKISDELADEIFRLIGVTVQQVININQGIVGQKGIISEVDSLKEEEIWNDNSIVETEKETHVKARIGQGQFRNNVSGIEPLCRVSGVSDPQFLRAGHIKPWRYCNNIERLDGNNGLMLAPHIDHLFDKGYITFEADGTMLISPHVSSEQLRLLGIDVNREHNVGPFSEAQEAYLTHHRNQVFLS